MNNFVAGHLTAVAFRVETNAVFVELSVREHNLDEEVLRYDVTHTRTLGKRARIAGILDMKGTVMAHYDCDAPPWLDPPRIRAGQSGILQLRYDGEVGVANLQPFSVPVIIARVHYQARVEDAVQYSFDYEMNVLADAERAGGAITTAALPDGTLL